MNEDLGGDNEVSDLTNFTTSFFFLLKNFIRKIFFYPYFYTQRIKRQMSIEKVMVLNQLFFQEDSGYIF